MENRDGEDQYGNHGFAVLDLGKERRQAGEKGPILGNWKNLDAQARGRDVPASEAMGKRDNSATEPDGDENIPFAPNPAFFQP